MTQFHDGEIAYLRKELLLRIAIQNCVLIMLMPLATTSFVLGLAWPARAEWAALAYVMASGMGALYWSHNGARTMQIAAYLRRQELEQVGQGWETWLKSNRYRGLLGSRWRISTMGVFLGSQVLVITLVGIGLGDGSIDWLVVAGGFSGLVLTACVLPHPRLPEKGSAP